MLVLTRCEQERIVIDGGRIVVTFIRATIGPDGRTRARLGFEAAPGCRIDREEVHKARLAGASTEEGGG